MLNILENNNTSPGITDADKEQMGIKIADVKIVLIRGLYKQTRNRSPKTANPPDAVLVDPYGIVYYKIRKVGLFQVDGRVFHAKTAADTSCRQKLRFILSYI